MLSKLDLGPKCQGHSRNQKTLTWKNKKHVTPKNLSRGSLNNWCDTDADLDTDADTNSSKTLC